MSKISITDLDTDAAVNADPSKTENGYPAGVIIGFHLPEEPYGFFSNWFRSECRQCLSSAVAGKP